MMMAGQIQVLRENGKGYIFETSFIHFYSSMLETPVLGKEINYIIPGSILFFSLLFAAIRYCKYENKVVTLIKRFNARLEGVVDQQDILTAQKSHGAMLGKIEKLYKGEIAYLKDLMQQREKPDRKQKLAQGKEVLKKRNIIPQAFTDKAEAAFKTYEENNRQIERLSTVNRLSVESDGEESVMSEQDFGADNEAAIEPEA